MKNIRRILQASMFVTFFIGVSDNMKARYFWTIILEGILVLMLLASENRRN